MSESKGHIWAGASILMFALLMALGMAVCEYCPAVIGWQKLISQESDP